MQKNSFLYKYIRLPIRSLSKHLTFKMLYPGIYRRGAKRPIDEKKVLFLELRHAKIQNSAELLERAIRRDTDYRTAVCCLRFGSVGLMQYIKNCCTLAKEAATAKYIVVTDRSRELSCLPIRPETKVIQVWHGCGAFKKFGRSLADTEIGLTSKELDDFPVFAHYSYVTVSSPEVIWAYKEAFGVGKDNNAEVVATGISRTDIFFDDKFTSTAADTFYRAAPQARGKKIVLYAPTFRGYPSRAQAPDALDLTYLHERLGDGYFIAVKHHPCVKDRPAIPAGLEDFAADVSDKIGIDELLCTCDICISDYSSLVFEYSLFERPLGFFAYDIDSYDGLRGFYYPFEEFTPGPILRTNEQLADFILDADNFDRERIRAFREKFMSSCDGHATRRIIDLMLSGDKTTETER